VNLENMTWFLDTNIVREFSRVPDLVKVVSGTWSVRKEKQLREALK